MLWHRSSYNPTAYDDDWEDQPAQGWFYKWVLGALAPALILGSAILVFRSGVFSYGQMAMTLHGANRLALALAEVAAALFIHCHYFWGNIYNQAWFAALGKIASAIVFIGALGFLIVRVGIFGKA